MTDIDTLFSEYRDAHRAGAGADPSDFLSRVEGTDRAELAALIDAYLARSPGRSWNSDAFAGSGAERVTNRIVSEWGEWELAPEPAGWQELLPTLRNKASLKRREVVERLAEALGVGEQTEKVAAYYHQMETGALPSEGVSDRALDALGRVLGESRERLRAAGSAVRQGAEILEAQQSVSFARLAIADEEYADEALAAPAPAEGQASPGEPADAAAEESLDEVDELFTGGPDA